MFKCPLLGLTSRMIMQNWRKVSGDQALRIRGYKTVCKYKCQVATVSQGVGEKGGEGGVDKKWNRGETQGNA